MTQEALNAPAARAGKSAGGRKPRQRQPAGPGRFPRSGVQHWTQLGRCQSDAVYELNGQVITQYFAGGYVTEVAGHCALELYPAPVHPVV